MSVRFATSTMIDGPMGVTARLTADEYKRRLMFVASHFHGRENVKPVMCESVHGTNVEIVRHEDAGRVMRAADGLLTNVPHLPIMMTHQDCVPIVLTDSKATFVGVVHAGWRGVVAGILQKAITRIENTFSNENPLSITIGAHLQSCHFAVQHDVAEQFAGFVEHRDGTMYVSLARALVGQAVRAGVPATSVVVSQDCTFCTPGYASWRRDNIAENNLVTVAMLTK